MTKEQEKIIEDAILFYKLLFEKYLLYPNSDKVFKEIQTESLKTLKKLLNTL